MEIDMDRIKQVVEEMATVLDHTRGVVRRDGGSTVRLRSNGRTVEMPLVLMAAGLGMLLVAGLCFGGREPGAPLTEGPVPDGARLQPVQR